MKNIIFLLFTNLLVLAGFSQPNSIDCYPTNWWAGMKNPNLQIMIHGK